MPLRGIRRGIAVLRLLARFPVLYRVAGADILSGDHGAGTGAVGCWILAAGVDAGGKGRAALFDSGGRRGSEASVAKTVVV